MGLKRLSDLAPIRSFVQADSVWKYLIEKLNLLIQKLKRESSSHPFEKSIREDYLPALESFLRWIGEQNTSGRSVEPLLPLISFIQSPTYSQYWQLDPSSYEISILQLRWKLPISLAGLSRVIVEKLHRNEGWTESNDLYSFLQPSLSAPMRQQILTFFENHAADWRQGTSPHLKPHQPKRSFLEDLFANMLLTFGSDPRGARFAQKLTQVLQVLFSLF